MSKVAREKRGHEKKRSNGVSGRFLVNSRLNRNLLEKTLKNGNMLNGVCQAYREFNTA